MWKKYKGKWNRLSWYLIVMRQNSFPCFKTFSFHFLSNNLSYTSHSNSSPDHRQSPLLFMLFNYFCFWVPFLVCKIPFLFFLFSFCWVKMEPLPYPLCYQQQNTNIINTIKGFPGCAHLSKALYLRNYTNESWKIQHPTQKTCSPSS